MRRRILFLAALAVVAAGVAFSLPRFADLALSYNFADRRTLLGIPNFMDVVSNAPYLAVGLLGLLFAARTRLGGWERMAFSVLFAGVLLTAFGSAYFHLAPSVSTIVWDRLPMSIIFMAVFAIVIAERIGLAAGRLLLFPLLALGIASVLYWRYLSDIRLYVLVQYFPMLAIPIMLAMFPARYRRSRDLLAVCGWYALAKIFELLDSRIFALTGAVSGHTLKHLAGAVATVWLLRFTRSTGHQTESFAARCSGSK